VNNKLNKTNLDNLIKNYQQNEEFLDRETSIEQESRETTKNKLEEIWIIFQESLIKTAKSTLPIKKVNSNNQNKNKRIEITPEHKRYRQAFRILEIFKKANNSKRQEDIRELEKIIKEFNNKTENIMLQIETNNLTTMEATEWKEKNKEIKEVIAALKEEAYRAQNTIKMREINKAIEQRCQHFQDNQRKMIDSLTNNSKKSIKIDRVMITTKQNQFIETDPKKVKKEVKEYYTKAFKRRKTDFERLNESWKKQYESRSHIEQEWYNNLLEKLSIQELG